MVFVTAKKLSSNLESPHFPMFSAQCCKCKIGKRHGHGKSRNGHGKMFCQVCGNPGEDPRVLSGSYHSGHVKTRG